jgi:hypothetical protein
MARRRQCRHQRRRRCRISCGAEPGRVGVGRRIGLDYLVIDCAETPRGELLVFEADNIGFVHATDSADVFPYKQPQMRKVFAAFRQMLGDAARRRAYSANASTTILCVGCSASRESACT